MFCLCSACLFIFLCISTEYLETLTRETVRLAEDKIKESRKDIPELQDKPSLASMYEKLPKEDIIREKETRSRFRDSRGDIPREAEGVNEEGGAQKEGGSQEGGGAQEGDGAPEGDGAQEGGGAQEGSGPQEPNEAQ